MWIMRCWLAIKLDALKDRIDDIADIVAPDNYAGWRKWEARQKKKGRYIDGS